MQRVVSACGCRCVFITGTRKFARFTWRTRHPVRQRHYLWADCRLSSPTPVSHSQLSSLTLVPLSATASSRPLPLYPCQPQPVLVPYPCTLVSHSQLSSPTLVPLSATASSRPLPLSATASSRPLPLYPCQPQPALVPYPC